jgi:hypothetical protein
MEPNEPPLACGECGRTIFPGETMVFRWARDVDDEGIPVAGAEQGVVLLHPECQTAYDAKHPGREG